LFGGLPEVQVLGDGTEHLEAKVLQARHQKIMHDCAATFRTDNGSDSQSNERYFDVGTPTNLPKTFVKWLWSKKRACSC
jgi:hypothetical protein